MRELQTHSRAVVIGASMVGLAVARALGERFQEVIVIDRDGLPTTEPEHRAGVPQSWHIHNLTLRGQNELEELFPGFVDEALKLGAMQVDYADDIARISELGWMPQFKSGFVALSATRVLFEFAERQRFRALARNVTVLERTRVENLLTEASSGRQNAVGVVTDHPEHREIRADLVVDCAGRSTRWKAWFEQRGLPLPAETVVDSHCGYSSRFYKPRAGAKFPWKGLVVDAAFPHQPHWGVIVPLERGEWVVTLGGFGGEFPPADVDGFEQFARNLRTPAFWQALREADPLTPVRTFRRMEMRWNHFERFAQPLGRFLVMGDAAWAYNPLYGQGMSIGVTCARILRDLLRKDADLDGLPQRYYPVAKKFAWSAWEATALRDLRWPKATGERPWHGALTVPFSEFVMRAGHHDNEVFKVLLSGIHLLKQPHELFTPEMVFRIARYGARQLAGKLAPEQHEPHSNSSAAE